MNPPIWLNNYRSEIDPIYVGTQVYHIIHASAAPEAKAIIFNSDLQDSCDFDWFEPEGVVDDSQYVMAYADQLFAYCDELYYKRVNDQWGFTVSIPPASSDQIFYGGSNFYATDAVENVGTEGTISQRDIERSMEYAGQYWRTITLNGENS